MTEEIKLVYATAEDMIRIFDQGVQQLNETEREMQGVASMLQEGALLGRGGTAFNEAIRGKLCPAIAKLAEKFQELSGDVRDAIEYMQEADRTSKGKF
jgi:WXG100 family type VII secretion target